MIRHDRLYLDLDDRQLMAALKLAVESFAPEVEPGLLWPLSGLSDLVRRWLGEAEGVVEWSLPDSRPTQLHRAARRIVRLFWWMDYLTRRHVRVLAEANDPTFYRYVDQVDPSPLLRIYPEAGVEVESADRPIPLLVVCPCGVVGSPDEVAWMGIECGPCHDRRAAGELPERLWDVPTRTLPYRDLPGERTSYPCRPRRFLDPDTLLIQEGDAWYAWDIRAGTVREELPIEVLAISPDGQWRVVVSGEREVRLETLEGDEGRSFETLGINPDVRFSASGRYLAVGTYVPMLHSGSLQVWDLQAGEAPVITHTSEGSGWTFAADDSAVFVAETFERIWRYPLGQPGTWTALPLPPDDEEDPEPVHRLLVTPDGRHLVVNRMGTLRTIEIATGRTLAERGDAVHADELAGAFLVLAGQAQAQVPQFSGQISLMRLSDLQGLARLTLAPPHRALSAVANAEWLALADETAIRLVPWGPLLDWYARTVGLAVSGPAS